jgi:TolA-binding protein
MKFFLYLFLLSAVASVPAFPVDSDALRYYNTAKAAYNDGAYSLAISFFEKARDAEPDGELADDCDYNIGLSYYQDGKYELSIQTFLKFMNTYPDSVYKERSQYMVGQSYFRIKNYDRASRELNDFIKHFPDSRLVPTAHYYLGVCRMALKRYEEAAEEFQLVIEKFSDASVAEDSMQKLAMCRYQDKDYQKAFDAFRQFLEKYPETTLRDEAEFFMGRSKYQLGLYQESSGFLTRMSQKTGARYRPEALYYLAMDSIQQNDSKQAVGYLATLAQIQKSGDISNDYREDALYKIALLYKAQEDYSRAATNFLVLLGDYKNTSYARNALKELADCQVLLEDWDGAQKTYGRMSALGGENVAIALERSGELKYLQKDYPGAIQAMNQLEKAYPDTVYASSALYWKGRSYMESGSFRDAIGAFENYLRENPSSQKREEIQMFLGNSYANSGDLDTALKIYNDVLRDYPTGRFADEALNFIAYLYIKKDEYARASDFYGQLIARYPKSRLVPLAWYSIGIIRYNLRDYAAALDVFRRVAQDYRGSTYGADAAIKIAWIHYKQENFDELVKYLGPLDITGFDSEQKSEVFNLLGWGNFRLKNYSSAVDAFRNSTVATTNLERSLEGLLYIAKSYYNAGDYTNAVSSYQLYMDRAIAGGNRDNIPAALSDMAWCHVKMGENAKAMEFYNQLVNDYPSSMYTAEALFKLAEYHYNREEFDTAVSYYQKILALSKDNEFAASARYWLAWSYFNMKDKVDALQAFEQYMNDYPNGDYGNDCLFRIAGIYNELNNYRKSMESYEKLIRLFPKSSEAEKANIVLSELRLKQESGGNREKLYQIMIKQSSTAQAKASAMYKLGKYYQENDKEAEAQKLFKQVIDTTTGEEAAQSIFELAEYNRQETNFTEAIKQYGNIFYVYKYAELYPQALYGLAYCYYKTGANDSAKKYLSRITERYPGTDMANKAKDLLKEIGN